MYITKERICIYVQPMDGDNSVVMAWSGVEGVNGGGHL